MKLAILSNVNMNVVIRMLKKEQDIEVYQAEGYGNELGTLFDRGSSYHTFDADITFMIMDLMELLGGNLDISDAEIIIGNWFKQFKSAMDAGKIYYVSDVYMWGYGMETCADINIKRKLENLWLDALEELVKTCSNIRCFSYAGMVQKLGENQVFSKKMWYMGKIPFTNDAQRELCSRILHAAQVEYRIPKKILFLDLDNTMWGGLAGENDITPVNLSEEHSGLAYKNLQRVILQMQKQGVLLGIISKNNEEDALAIIEKHPHMVLRQECFAVKKINWVSKDKNIADACRELNIGVDSAVFWDDNPAERELIKSSLPEVIVPDFPDRPEELPDAMELIYHQYFEKSVVTAEDINKTRQYAENVERKRLQENCGNYEEYLKSLKMRLTCENAEKNSERFLQLVNKTNQFNLTTKRYTKEELAAVFGSPKKRTYIYGVADKFGDNGLVAALIVDVSGDVPVIEEFTMSCRVMGRNIEHAIITDIEQKLLAEGYENLRGIYTPTEKNRPVAELYRNLGYNEVGKTEDNGTVYEIKIANSPKRVYHVLTT